MVTAHYNPAFMQLAFDTANASRCNRLHVGAVLLDDRGVVAASSCNDNPAAVPCDCWPGQIRPCDNTMHAEVGSILASYQQIIRRDLERPEILHPAADAYGCMSGWTMYVTHSPCRQCAVVIGTAGIRTVYYAEQYGSPRGLEYLSIIRATVAKVDFEGIN